MEPTIGHGAELNVLAYGDASPQRNDVIVFLSPTNIERMFVKRIIAIPGDKIEIIPNGDVLVNGDVVEEPHAQGTTTCREHTEARSYASLRGTVDSASNENLGLEPSPGPSPPLAPGESPCNRTLPSGAYFVMGDNRQNSSDSRQGWLVPEGNIIGYLEGPAGR